MQTIVLSVFGNRISSRLDVAEKVMIVKVDNNAIKSKEILLLDSADILKKLDALIQLKPDLLICGGLTELCKKRLGNNKIRVLPWVQGDIETVLKLYLEGSLTVKNNYNFINH